MPTFFEVITEAVKDVEEHGYDPPRVERWKMLIESKLAEIMPTIGRTTEQVNRELRSIYGRLVDRGGLAKLMPSGVSLFTINQVRPKLRTELERSILANANLIKNNRVVAKAITMRRFDAWCSSIPPGGSRAVKKKVVKTDIRKALASLPFEERRVAIDQGHKLVSALSDITAVGSNAIAAAWRSQWRQKNYNYRVDHKERDGLIYVVRGCWAIEQGLIIALHGYTDEITKPAEEVFCRCKYQYYFALRDLPDEMLTDKGRAWLAEARAKREALMAGVK